MTCVVINLGECFKYTREALHSKLGEGKSLRKVAESFYTFLTTPDEVEKYVEGPIFVEFFDKCFSFVI